ncbi:MAG: SGNH/GDSL hydrolase family protein [Selenomonadaceae bacterium]|nr:SGNH/GDSL hydrolase family protein [Selenomonadaceae bacterium]
MKNFFTFMIIAALMSFFSIFSMYIAEKTDVLQLNGRPLEVKFSQEGDDTLMTWRPLPYPCVYKITTVSRTTGLVEGEPPLHIFKEDESRSASYIVPRAPIPTYYFITARGLFGEIFRSEKIYPNPNFPTPPHPVSIYHYDKDNPASLMPFLVWHTVPNAVCYELEILDAPPEVEGGIALSTVHHLDSTKKIYTNGYQADLRPFKDKPEIYWRARALGLHHEPIGEFCKAEQIIIDATKPFPNCPLINNFDFMDYLPQPIYHVFDWIPLHEGAKYEVEMLTHPPAVENDTQPSLDSVWRMISNDVASCYDEYGRPYAGAYYWRVRALDENNNPIGTWSNSEKFIVDDYTQGVDVAVLGDSISHGGGAVSYSPRALQYSYETFIDFPVINLSRSGDTSRTTLERFNQDVLQVKPKNLIISTGANCLRDASISAQDVISDLAGINNLCLQNGIRPIFLTLMPINPANLQNAFHTPTDPNWYSKLVQINDYIKRQEFFIDIAPYFYDAQGTMNESLSVDGIHPDIRGKMLIGEIISKNKNLFRD